MELCEHCACTKYHAKKREVGDCWCGHLEECHVVPLPPEEESDG